MTGNVKLLIFKYLESIVTVKMNLNWMIGMFNKLFIFKICVRFYKIEFFHFVYIKANSKL